MDDVICVKVIGPRSSISWCQIFQTLNTGTRGCTHSRDAQIRPENLVQMLLFRPEIFACACFSLRSNQKINQAIRVAYQKFDRSAEAENS
jgi:hypothetical protein